LKRTEYGYYQIHSLLHQFASSHLDQNEQAMLLNIHSHYYLSRLRELEANIKGQAQREALNEIEQEFDNFSMAWTHTCEQQDFAALNYGLEGLFWFCVMRNRYLEGETIFQQAEAQFAQQTSDEAATFIARVKLRRLWLKRWREGSLASQPDILSQLNEILALFRRAENDEGIAMSLLLLGDASYTTKSAATDSYMQESLELYNSLGDEFYIAWVMHFMARQAVTSKGLATAIELQQQSLTLRRQHNDVNGVIYALYNLSIDFLQTDQLAESLNTAQEMLNLSLQMGERSGELMASTTLSLVACLQADFELANTLSQRALNLAADLNHLLGKAYGLVVQSLSLLITNQTVEARTVLEQLDKLATHELVRFFYNLCAAIAACNTNEWDNVVPPLHDALRYAIAVRGVNIMRWCFFIYAVWIDAQDDQKAAERLLRLAQSDHANQLFAHWSQLVVLQDKFDATRENTNEQPRSEANEELEAAAKRLLQSLMAGSEATSLPAHILTANQALLEPLSIRELEVLASIVEGLSNQQIADSLIVEISTIKKHITNIYGKLGVGSRTQAVIRAQQLGLV
jgi:DNA-binding CsgD family transcriptional regulator